jgi:hypothetical protein
MHLNLEIGLAVAIDVTLAERNAPACIPSTTQGDGYFWH